MQNLFLNDKPSYRHEENAANTRKHSMQCKVCQGEIVMIHSFTNSNAHTYLHRGALWNHLILQPETNGPSCERINRYHDSFHRCTITEFLCQLTPATDMKSLQCQHAILNSLMTHNQTKKCLWQLQLGGTMLARLINARSPRHSFGHNINPPLFKKF